MLRLLRILFFPLLPCLASLTFSLDRLFLFFFFFLNKFPFRTRIHARMGYQTVELNIDVEYRRLFSNLPEVIYRKL